MALDIKTRRIVGLNLGCQDAANSLCDAVDSASAAVAAADLFLMAPLGDLAAGGSVTDIIIAQQDVAITLLNIKLIAQGAFVGVDASNTIVVTVKDGDGNTIVTKTYDNSTVPTDNGANALGTLDSTHKLLAANEAATIDVVCGATANPPVLLVQIRYRPQ